MNISVIVISIILLVILAKATHIAWSICDRVGFVTNIVIAICIIGNIFIPGFSIFMVGLGVGVFVLFLNLLYCMNKYNP